LDKQHVKERTRLSDEHAAALATQRKEQTEVAEHAENQLMLLRDQERQEAKATESKLSGNLEKVTQKIQFQRETIIALESSVTELTRQSEKLDSELAARVENNSALQAHSKNRRRQLHRSSRNISPINSSMLWAVNWEHYRMPLPAFRLS
jgi:chromosome segregation ATPase